MSIKIYNTLTRRKENFVPLKDKAISMYICGPTVYSDCHIGHIMGPVIFDSIARWFKLNDYSVNFVNNITDIDDKIINKSQQTGEDWQSITQRYTKQYFDLLEKLQVSTISHFPKCTDYIDEMITYIEKLIDKGYAYSANDGIYFAVEKKTNYGKLSGRKLENNLTSQQTSHLKNSADFCLWKLAKPNEPSWGSPWGQGRPGWHLECSVMSNALFGNTFDIHGGGDDLKFPHHENEIAQGEAFGGTYAQCWMHNGLIEYEGQKVGKSDPRMQDENFSQQFNANYLIETYGADVVRFFLLRGHYRRPFDFAPKEIKSIQKALQKIIKAFKDNNISHEANSLQEVKILAENCHQQQAFDKFINAMNDDFNTGLAIAEVFNLITLSKKDDKNCQSILTFCYALLSLLGIKLELNKKETILNDNTMNDLMKIFIELRQEARNNNNWQLSDDIRDKLINIGIILQDSPQGCQWSKKDD